MKPPRVLFADDHALLLDAFRTLLAPHCEIVGAVADGRPLVEAAERLRPEVIVEDIGMLPLNGPMPVRSFARSCRMRASFFSR